MAAARRLDTSRISFGEMVAGVSAVVLLITMFLPWYGVSVKGSIGAFSGSASKDFDAWQAFGGRDVIIFLVTVLVLAYLLVRLLGVVAPAVGVDASLVIAGLGALAAVLILIGIIHIPDSAGGAVGNVHLPGVSTDHGRKFWLFVGFLGACGIAYGGWAAYNESRRGVVPAAAGPGGGLTGPGAVTPPTTPSAAPTEPLGTPPAPGGTAPSAPPPGAGMAPTPAPPGGGTAATPTPPGGAPPSTPPGPAAPSSTPPPQPGQPGNPPADWYPDPHGQARLRWWDGSQWTDQTAN